MTDELEKLSDAKLSEVFAVEVKGFAKHENKAFGIVWKDREGAVSVERQIHRFATSADAVLPHVEKLAYRVEWGRSEGCQYGVFLWPAPVPCEPIRAIQPTLPRALCIALIKAARAQKGAA